MAFRLDQVDWTYAKRDAWLVFALASLLWPLLLLRPKVLLDPSGLFLTCFFPKAMARHEVRFWISPPPCGRLIRFRPIKVMLSGGDGEFVFQSADVEKAIEEDLRENPPHAIDQRSDVLRWLKQRDESITEPTLVPNKWWNFYAIADGLLRKGHGEVRCTICNQQIFTAALHPSDVTGQPGWNFNQLCCPEGHVLLSVETMHIFVGSRNETEAGKS